MPSNFDFLALRLPHLRADATEAERIANTAPRAAVIQCRYVLESAAQWIYDHDRTLSRPYEDRLGAMIHDATFRANLPPSLFEKVRAIHLAGNQAAHRATPMGPRDSVRAVSDLFHFLYWISRTYSPDATQHPKVTWDASLVPAGNASELTEAKIQALTAAYEERLARAAAESAKRAETLTGTEEEIARLKAELAALKAKNQATDTHDYDEATTRDAFIDLLLKEAGWPLDQPGVHTEFPVTGMPNRTGQGFVDYVLWGEDGVPLGLVEAKATRHGPEKGQHQAKLYADCLEARYGRRPVIFLSNGYTHQVWDDRAGPPRPVAAFYTRDELARLHWRRANAKDPAAIPIDPGIAGRPYQHEAIRAVCEHFAKGHRRALVVMATGTGKTRTTIALVDLLLRAGMIRRVLFLADRTSLLTQARRAFRQHLPRLTTIDLLADPTGDGEVYLSTYPTMINLVDRFTAGRRRFGPGFFDLVVTDEAHRSIYKKFGDLFDWFDGRLLGLTATPRAEVARDTYRIFELEQGVPTHDYPLERAIAEGYLVPPEGKSVPFRFLRRGIKYAELSDADKEAYEDAFTDAETGEMPDSIDAKALNEWVFNADTVDQALDFVMEHGLRVEDGSRLGKTIVFARNHDHAVFVVERFDKKWPAYKGTFAAVIDSRLDYAQSVLDQFSERDRDPHLAVSVDMLDTGVDVPEVLNLVLFRAVSSKTKFQQIIGRGTRLCPDLFGPGKDKRCFRVFDLCGNFEFFEQAVPEAEGALPAGLGETLLRRRAALFELLPDDETDLRRDLLDRFHAHVAGMDESNFRVRAKRATRELAVERSLWDAMKPEEVVQTVLDLAALPTSDGVGEDLDARRFDLLALRLQIGLLNHEKGFVDAKAELERIASNLLEKAGTLPMVARQRTLLEAIGQDAWWESLTLRRVEQARLALRDLLRFVDRKARPRKETDIEDTLLAPGGVDVVVPGLGAAVDRERYRRKVEAFLRSHLTHVSVAKLRHNRPLTPSDLEELERLLHGPDAAGSPDALARVLDGEPLPVFIRRLVGLDAVALRQAIDGWIAGRTLTHAQLHLLTMIVDFLARNGVMDPALLYEPPFVGGRDTPEDVLGDELAGRVVALVREANANAGWAPPRAAQG